MGGSFSRGSFAAWRPSRAPRLRFPKEVLWAYRQVVVTTAPNGPPAPPQLNRDVHFTSVPIKCPPLPK